MKIYIVDAFTAGGGGGNGAGVVLDAGSFSAERCQEVAGWVGLSETAFVEELQSGGHRVRFFTPTSEVGLCGHATIASYFLLGEVGRITPGELAMETRAGVMRVGYQSNGTVSMTQSLPVFGDTLEPGEVAGGLGVQPEDIGSPQGLPVQLASTGLVKIFVPVKSGEVLERVRPNYGIIEEVSRRYGAIGMYVYALGEQGEVTARCRNFAPVVGIKEDAATGTSAAALGCVLHRHDALGEASAHQLRFEQGYSIGSPSELGVNLKVTARRVSEVEVVGAAHLREVRETSVFGSVE